MKISSRLSAGSPGERRAEIVVDLFDPLARDAPRLLRRRQNCQRIRDCLLDNPIDHVGHRDLPKTMLSERRGATAAPIPQTDILQLAPRFEPNVRLLGVVRKPVPPPTHLQTAPRRAEVEPQTPIAKASFIRPSWQVPALFHAAT
jgi:hypothetical protein